MSSHTRLHQAIITLLKIHVPIVMTRQSSLIPLHIQRNPAKPDAVILAIPQLELLRYVHFGVFPSSSVWSPEF